MGIPLASVLSSGHTSALAAAAAAAAAGDFGLI